MFAGQELRSTDRPIYGLSALTINDTLYFYGGAYHTPPWNGEALWSVPSTVDTFNFEQVPTNSSASPALKYHAMTTHPTNPNLIYTFGGHIPTNTSALAPPESIRYYVLNLKSLRWTPLQKTQVNLTTATGGMSMPRERFYHTAARYQGTVYLLGGMSVTGPVDDGFWGYDMMIDQWRFLGMVPARCGHTASMLSDGRMVVLGGYPCVGNYSTNPLLNKQLHPLNEALVYDTLQASWQQQPLTASSSSSIPNARTYHTATTLADDRIVICGGQDGQGLPFQTYVSSMMGDAHTMTAILHTRNWTWQVPPVSPHQPFSRSFAAATVVNGSKMVIGFGINDHTMFDGLYVFDADAATWLPDNIPDAARLIPSTSSRPSTYGPVILMTVTIALVATLATVLLITVFFFLKRRMAIQHTVVDKVKAILWDPRTGEPLWTELARFLFRVVFLVVFVVELVIIALQVGNSPVIDQKYDLRTEALTVHVPDIRFCFDGWGPGSRTMPYLRCATDLGDSCSGYILNITDNIQTGLNYYGGHLTCYLFRAPPSFRLGQASHDRTASNGAYLKFHYHGDVLPSNSTRVHVVFYHHDHDPNLAVYNISSSEGEFAWYTPDENAAFQSTEQVNLRTENAFDLNPNTVSTGGYTLIEQHAIADDNAWNVYVGIGTVRHTRYAIKSHATTEDAGTWTPAAAVTTPSVPFGAFHVFPGVYAVTVIHEQRAFTVFDAVGTAGGIWGLLVGLQTFLFGVRPLSPWGVVHRWAVGQMRHSLFEGLRSRFLRERSTVPIVHPVHRRFSVMSHAKARKQQEDGPMAMGEEEEEEDERRRIAKLEERLHVFEMLFQAYYINDEVFRSLAHANPHTPPPHP